MTRTPVNQIATMPCPLCTAVMTPVQANTTPSGVTAWYRCPDTGCYSLPVRVRLAAAEGVITWLGQHTPPHSTTPH